MKCHLKKWRQKGRRHKKNCKLKYLGNAGMCTELRTLVSGVKLETRAYRCFSSEDTNFYLLEDMEEKRYSILGIKEGINKQKIIIGEIDYYVDEFQNIGFDKFTISKEYRGKEHYAVKFLKAFLRSEYEVLLDGKNVYVHPCGGIEHPRNDDNELTALTNFYQRFGMIVCRDSHFDPYNPPIVPEYQPIEDYTEGLIKLTKEELRINLEKEIANALKEG